MDIPRAIDRDHDLPPSAEPLFPEFLKPGEWVVVRPKLPDHVSRDPIERSKWLLERNRAHDAYCEFGDAYMFKPRYTWLNEPPVGPAWRKIGEGRGTAGLEVPVRLRLDRRKGTAPDVFSGTSGMLYLSERVLEVILGMDAQAVEHVPVELYNRTGERTDQRFHFIDVVRCVPAIDFANSEVEYLAPRSEAGIDYPALVLAKRHVQMMPGLDPDWHIFRQRVETGPPWPPGGDTIFVSKALKTRLKALRPPPSNAGFRPLNAVF